MTRLEILTLKLADDELNDAESHELEALLTTESEAAAVHTLLLELEAALRGQRETLELGGPTLTRLRSELGVSVARGVLEQLEAEPPPAWARSRALAQAETHDRKLQRPNLFPKHWMPPKLSRAAVVAFAACIVLLLSLSVWFFTPTMGEPVLAGVKGADASIERGTEFVPVANGMVLQPADVLHLGTNALARIAFGAEQTRLELSAGTQLKLTSLARGKRFMLQGGRIEASVARQRPFHAMIISTPQAEAKVLGTKFSLLTTANSTRLEVAKGKVKFTSLHDGQSVQVGAESYAVAASNHVLASLPLPGKVLREVWLDLPGDSLQDLRYHERFPNAPSGRDFPPSFETNTNWPSAYGTRTRAYLLPLTNGVYDFSISGIGQIGLWLSPDDDPAGKVKIAQIVFTKNRPGDPRSNKNRARNQSGPIPLEAGRRYYIEAQHKYATGEDRLTILWKRPDGTAEEPIPSDCLAPFKLNAKERK